MKLGPSRYVKQTLHAWRILWRLSVTHNMLFLLSLLCSFSCSPTHPFFLRVLILQQCKGESKLDTKTHMSATDFPSVRFSMFARHLSLHLSVWTLLRIWKAHCLFKPLFPQHSPPNSLRLHPCQNHGTSSAEESNHFLSVGMQGSMTSGTSN